MPGTLRLQIDFDDDGTAELFARVEANDFSGHGSAWISPSQLSDLGSDLAKSFPLTDTLQIAGGYWSQSTPHTLTQEHLALAFYPVAGRGVVGCQVRLASPVQSGERQTIQSSVQVELLTSYEQLQHFGRALARLATGEAREAVLHGVAV